MQRHIWWIHMVSLSDINSSHCITSRDKTLVGEGGGNTLLFFFFSKELGIYCNIG